MVHSIRNNSAIEEVVSGCRRAAAWLLLFSLAINLLVLTSPLYMLQVYDRVLASGRYETLLFLTVIAGFAVLVMGIIETARSRFLARIGEWLDQRLCADVIRSVITERYTTGGGSTQSLRDLTTLRSTLSSPGVNSVIDTPWVPAFIVIIWLMHPLLGLIALAAAITLYTIGFINEMACRNALGLAGQLSVTATSRVESALRNAEAVRAMGMIPPLIERFRLIGAQGHAAHRIAIDRGTAIVGLSKSFRLFVQILILGSGAWLVLKGELTAGGMIAASILLGRALAPVDQSIGAWKQLAAALDAWKRIKRLLSDTTSESDGLRLPEPLGAFECENVTFIPPNGERPALKDVSLRLAPGELLGVMGPSAAGKSTLCKLAAGICKPTHGRVRLDGGDITEWHRDDVGRYFGYLPQDIEIFAGSVAENIARLEVHPDPEAVVEAAQLAGAHDMILSLPQGYNTQVGESGSFLSGGQRQRIGLARAFYGKPKLIVLDEPNAGLDLAGEKALDDALQAAKQWGATIILVAHQPRIMRNADKIILIRDGEIDASGSPSEVFGQLRSALELARPDALVQASGT